MSLARAFTTRRVKQSLQAADGDSLPQRSNTTRGSISSLRHKISAPVELVHTTNMLSYNAPDLFPKLASPATSSVKSDDTLSDSSPTSASTPPTSPDEPSPKLALSEANHLSRDFTVLPEKTAPAAVNLVPNAEAPEIPKRAPSRAKNSSYEQLGRQRSMSRLSEQSGMTLSSKASFSFSRSSSSSTSTSITSHVSASIPPQQKVSFSEVRSNPTSPKAASATHSSVHYHHKKEYSESHPFGQELAQVKEIAEEYGVKEQLAAIDEEERELAARGLFKFSAEEYLSEVRELFSAFFPEPRPTAVTWI
ncbi:hypothetical protein VTK73DRAFT_2630 [Phialemonium thermophilum]|uniref:Uncharacterized protein n=1 Tax=Phialemonium thermophilum TaxID=223376 RepID=A0ABR3X4B6_9PEZI